MINIFILYPFEAHCQYGLRKVCFYILTSVQICQRFMMSAARESGCLASFSDRQYKSARCKAPPQSIRALHLALCLLFIQLPVYFWSVSVLPDVIPLSIRFMPFLMTSFAFSVLSVSSRARMESSKIHSSGFPISSPLS